MRKFFQTILRHILCFVVLLLFLPCRAWAVITELNQNMELGNLTQLKERSKITLEKDGRLSHIDGFLQNTGSVSLNASLTFTPEPDATSGQVHLIDVGEFSLNGVGCTLRLNNLQFSQKDIKDLSQPMTVTLGGTLEARDGYCTQGEYSGILYLQYETCDTKDCKDGRQSHSIPINISVYLTVPLSVENKQDMNFGTVLSPASASTITISPSGTYSYTGNLTFIETDITPGQFEILGLAGRSVSVTLPSSATLTNATGQTMITISPTSPVSLVGGKGETMGTGTINVGGTLHLQQSQKSGSYEGTYSVVVSY